MVNSALNVSLIGYGYAGKTLHAPLIIGTRDFNLCVIVSSDAKRVAHDFPNVLVESDVKAVFDNPNIDLVVIATPNETHFSLAAAALENGKHVVLDKPMVISSWQCARLYEIAKHKNRLLSVFQNRRWDADFLTLQKIIARNGLGEISHFQSNFNRYRPNPQERWRERNIVGGGLWFDIGSHLIDQALVLFGLPETVSADLEIKRQESEVTDYFNAVLKYGKSRVTLHASSLVMAEMPRFEIHGKTGSYVKYGLDTQEECLKRGEKPGGTNWGLDPELGMLYKQSDELSVRQESNSCGDYLAYYAAIRDAILIGNPNPVQAAEAMAVIKILELGVESSQRGKVLSFDSDESDKTSYVLG